MPDKQQLRKRLRQQRRSLTIYQQRLAARALQQLICKQPAFIRSQRIAFYLANDGEIDPTLLLSQAVKLGKHCYLPILQNNRSLLFGRYKPGDKLVSNHFQIPEPIHKERLRPQQLDLVFMPLVGFDRLGGRLGMGGGFYDRSFSFKRRAGSFKQRASIQTRPLLFGLAHVCQELEQCPMESWDIPLQGVVTQREMIT